MTDAVLVLDLFTTEAILGGDERLVKGGRVSFGRPMIYPVHPDELDPLLARRPDHGQRKYVLLHFPFDLEPPRAGRRYESATIGISFEDDVAALDITPIAPHGDEQVHLDIRGIGRTEVAWDLLAGEPAAGLRARSRVMQVVLDIPAGATGLRGALSAKLTIAPGRREVGTQGRPQSET
ncbi:hypothetical protein [Actinoplanes sp. NPDC089786]|uniref:hypothetical protein n=1 Tax=Actinoplanes sp. NPDC089786 TaxID=3155185 RepID=UPI0034338651